MKPTPIQFDNNAGVVNNILILAILGIIVGVGYFILNDGIGSLFDVFEEGAGGWVDSLISGTAGGLGALWSGKYGIKTSTKTIWKNSKLSPKNWF
jgi:hypothetical protein